jgi:2-dehydropantoate 2-reductase
VNIVIVGAGSMGCLVGGYLARAEHDVFLLDVDPDRVAAIEEGGLVVEGVGGDFDVQPRAATVYEGDPPELVVVCVKAFDTDRAGRSIAEFIGEDSIVLTLQNGVGNLEQLAHHLPREQLVAGVTSLGANLLRPGHVHHAGEGETHVGHLSGEEMELASRVAGVLDGARLPATASPDIRTQIWSKLAVNVGINALTAILRVRNGKLLSTEHAESVLRDAVHECLEVAGASGIPLAMEATFKRVREVARLTASNRSSMLMDVLAGRRTEVDAINGAVVRRGLELGVPVPVNQTLTRLVHALERLHEMQER